MTEQDHIDGYREWFLSGEELDATRTKIAALNRRAVRRGFTGRIKVEARPATRSHVPAQGAPTVTEHGFAVTISGEPPCYSGWRFIAAADIIPQRPATAADQPAGAAADSPGIAAGAPRVVLRYAPGADPIDNATVRPGECDHCHTMLARGTTFLVQHERSGELRQVGRSCLKDFLGHTALPVFIDADQIADQVERRMREAPQAAAWDLHSVLTYAWATVETHGWAPASSPHSTRDLVAQALAGGPHSTEVLASIRPKLGRRHPPRRAPHRHRHGQGPHRLPRRSQTVLVRPKRQDHPQVADPHPAPAGPAWEQVRQVPPQARFQTAPLASGPPPTPGLAV